MREIDNKRILKSKIQLTVLCVPLNLPKVFFFNIDYFSLIPTSDNDISLYFYCETANWYFEEEEKLKQ